jgi:hypothetical protein
MDGRLAEEVTLGTGVHVDAPDHLYAAPERFTDRGVIALKQRNGICVSLDGAGGVNGGSRTGIGGPQ